MNHWLDQLASEWLKWSKLLKFTALGARNNFRIFQDHMSCYCYWPGSELGYLRYHGNDMQNMWGNPAGVNPPENLALFISPLFIVVLWCIVLYSDCWSSALAQSQLSLVQFSVLWLINSPFLRQFSPLLWVRFVDQILVFASYQIQLL